MSCLSRINTLSICCLYVVYMLSVFSYLGQPLITQLVYSHSFSSCHHCLRRSWLSIGHTVRRLRNVARTLPSLSALQHAGHSHVSPSSLRQRQVTGTSDIPRTAHSYQLPPWWELGRCDTDKWPVTMELRSALTCHVAPVRILRSPLRSVIARATSCFISLFRDVRDVRSPSP